MIGFLIPLFLWSTITTEVNNFAGYNQKLIVNYFIYAYILFMLILSPFLF
ncbi:MAG: hypothetical protein N2482_00565 [Patescibacteria group bacterium]|nr:hypothetical protein [Patescibacteria group bacterium]